MSSQSQSSWWDYVPPSLDLSELVHSTKEEAAERLREAVGAVADAGNAAVQEAVEFGNGVVDAGQEAALGLQQAGGDIFDAIADAIVVDEEGDGQDVEQAIDLPEQDAEQDPAEEAAEEVIDSGGDTYKDQRDNESAHVGGDYSCSPTSFTAALIDLVGDESAVKARTVELIDAAGGNSDYQQTEELIIELLMVTDWATVCKAHPEFFWNGKEWATWAAGSPLSGKYYKDPYAQQYVASLYDGVDASGTEAAGGVFGYEAWKPYLEALDDGAEVTAEGDAMTGSGHVIRVLEGDASGLLINDPYGLWVHKGIYLKNGAETLPILGGDQSTFDDRASRNAELSAQYDAYRDEGPDWTPYTAWGQNNWYPWADAEEAKIGDWVSVLRKA